jgi:hypothetical protein
MATAKAGGPDAPANPSVKMLIDIGAAQRLSQAKLIPIIMYGGFIHKCEAIMYRNAYIIVYAK